MLTFLLAIAAAVEMVIVFAEITTRSALVMKYLLRSPAGKTVHRIS